MEYKSDEIEKTDPLIPGLQVWELGALAYQWIHLAIATNIGKGYKWRTTKKLFISEYLGGGARCDQLNS